ncbi:MAG: double zinc ribbon domain-containing protein [Clostridiales Family XIII bacterium]|jgi:ComF family protein|nr:double zinc ribbon domain-containing protein [Clostridiales Family XIII bacterium]
MKNINLKELAKAAPQGEAAAGAAPALRRLLKKTAKAALDLLYPPSIYCIACGNLIDASRPYALCDACRERFGWANDRTCDKCGKPLRDAGARTLCANCADGGQLFEKGCVCVEYADCRELLYGFKYGGRTYYGAHIARVMHDRLLWEAHAHGAPPQIDLLLPVPMYGKKERKRGYNQADVAGRQLARLIALPYDRTLLERTRSTRVMSSLSAEERGANVQGAFALARGREEAVRGLRVMLVDDIFTTGSTIDACAETLLSAGAVSVRFIVFAAGADAGTDAGDLRGAM